MNSTRWSVAVTIRTTATDDQINHLTNMLSMLAGEVTVLNERLLIKATTDHEHSWAEATREVLYPIEAWLRCFNKPINLVQIEADRYAPERGGGRDAHAHSGGGSR